MNKNKVLILGGYGNFGKRIAAALVKGGIPVIIAGRNQKKAESLAQALNNQYSENKSEIAILDVKSELSSYLRSCPVMVAINNCGPFQNSDYQVAKTCLEHGVNYIDLADGREFACKISALQDLAKKNQLVAISGASTVPGLSSAVIEHYKKEFSVINSLTYGISPGAKAERGLATTKAILSYLGKPLNTYSSRSAKLYGWQDIYRQDYPLLGKRWMANCDIPDLDLFPKIYNIKQLRFSAGMESAMLHLGMWLLSWMVRLGLPLNLEKHSGFLLQASHYFDFLGTDKGGMHMIMEGLDLFGKPKKVKWFIIALEGDGPQIPCVPSIILAKKLISKKLPLKGALPCVGLVTLEEYMEELGEFNIKQYQF